VIRTVIVGAGMAGLTLARLLRRRGHEPVVLERGPAGAYQPRGFMLGYQGFEAFEELGILAGLRARGWDVAPRSDGVPTGVAVDVGHVLSALAEDVPVAHGETVVDLVREGGRVVGVVTEGPAGRVTVASDLVIACDGRGSPTRGLAGLPAERHPLNDAYLSFLSPVAGRTGALRYLSDGGMITALAWPEGSSGSRRIDPIGEEAAKGPDIGEFRRTFAALLPEAAEIVAGVDSWDRVRYVEPALLRCPRWWTPGVAIMADAAHTFGPDTGVGAGVGLQDAHAMAEAIARSPDADSACAAYATWREPAVRPLEAMDPAWRRMGEIPPRTDPLEDWPPPG
jgi:2-polyprenyl-6-methoxyphenol hydroxylase-like FAD-dependent oxidoreductase